MASETAIQEIEDKTDSLYELARKIWNNPEVANKEVNACKWTAEYLEAEGFDVEVGYANVPTAIRASFGSGYPTIGFLGEYDALPGMSQQVSTEKEPVVSGGPGEACGHNLLGVACVGAVVGIKKEMEEKGLSGTIVYYGCPAEEILTGKAFMARDGAFRELDCAIAWHPGSRNSLTSGTMTALNTVRFHFTGVTAHAGGDPYNGRSALDAAELMNVGANFLREHVTSDVRIHYVLTEAGTAPNIVPDRATNWYYVRALSREAVTDTYERLLKVAYGAAMMTETEVEVEYTGGCYNTMENSVIAGVLLDSIQKVGFPEYTEEELAFAAALDEQSPSYAKSVATGIIKEGVHIDTEVPQIKNENSYGSTDVGDVQHIVPCSMFSTATANIGAPGHSWMIASCSGHSIGLKGMLNASKIMADAALTILADTSIVERAKEEFAESMKGQTYDCPIPVGMAIPE